MFAGTRFGGAKRLFYLAKELERYAEVTVLCLDGCREVDARRPPPADFPRMLHLPLDPAATLRQKAEILPGVRAVFASRRDSIAAFLGSGAYDATLMAFPSALRFLDSDWPCPLGRLVYLEDDLMAEQYRKQAADGSLRRRLAGWIRYRQALRFYNAHLAGVQDLICISREEAAIMEARHPGIRSRVLAYGLPLREYPLLPNPADPAVLGFIGNYRHLPNLDAARWLAEEVFPFLAANVQGAKLVLAGPNLPEGFGNGNLHPGIEVRGEVADLAGFYASIGVFINPLRQGRGLRTKVVEAAAFGRPIVSTALGAEGLGALDIGIGEDKEGLLRAYRAVLDGGGEGYRARAERNREAVEAGFSLAALGRELAGILAGTGAVSRGAGMAAAPGGF